MQATGRRFRGRHLVLLVAPGGAPMVRVGYTVSRKVGNAVVRNRVRRRLREIVRLHARELVPSRDYVIIAAPGAALRGYHELADDLVPLLTRVRSWTPAA